MRLLLYRLLMVLEHKTRGRLLHLAKCSSLEGPSLVAKGVQNI